VTAVPERAPAGQGLHVYLAHADQMIIAGELRIGRLELLTEAMAAAACETDGIADLMTRHLELLQSWNARRSEIIDRLATAALKPDLSPN
jgi:hypothetical protein